MQSLIVSLINFISLAPVIYLGGVAFTATSFAWMKSIVREYIGKSEWPYIIIILVNGMVPTILSASDVPLVSRINPALVVLLTPIFAILEFAILSRDNVRVYVFFAGMIMLLFACFFGIGATIITSVHVPENIINSATIRAASMTFTLFLLSLSIGVYTFSTRNITGVIKYILHDWTSGVVIFVYMIINGITLGIATGFDYEVYFSTAASNPYRNATVSGMVLRYILILITSWLLIFVQTRVEINRRKADRFESQANTDPLTGLLNRAGMGKKMETAQNNNDNGEGTAGAFFLFDLDHFKEVNDHLGHPVGDEMLKRAAEIIVSQFRDKDLVCRLGGDEFCVFTKGLTDRELVEKKAGLLNESLRFEYVAEDGYIIRTSASIGIAILPEHGPDAKTLYHNADAALYEAKEKGRDCYVIAGIMKMA